MLPRPDLHRLLRAPGGLFRRLVSQCAVCRSWPAGPVCEACLSRFGEQRPRCMYCALELPAAWVADLDSALPCPACQRQAFGLDRCFAAVAYAYPWSDVIGRYKFNQHTGWSSALADLLLCNPGARALLQDLTPSDWVLPLPLSATRLGERGFNQSWELACALHRQSECTAQLRADVLLRIRHTHRQSQLKRADRLSNVAGAFAVDPLQVSPLRGRQVVLVDDVMTSGASLLAATRALRAAGVSTVSALVLARTAPT